MGSEPDAGMGSEPDAGVGSEPDAGMASEPDPGPAAEGDSAGPSSESIATSSYAEDRDAEGQLRPGYDATLTALGGADLARLGLEVAAHLERRGVSFGREPFVVDPVPRLLSATEWDGLARGLAQRAAALNRFLADAYGERRIVTAGIVGADRILGAEGFEPDLAGALPAHGAPAAIIGFDVVRDNAGEFLVLEDNLRTPSGFAYALAAREALTAALPAGFPSPRPIDPLAYELLGGALRAAAPSGVDEPSIVVLTDGPANVAYYEHAEAAARLGVPLVTPDELVPVGAGLALRRPEGGTDAVDVVYRRTDEDRLRDDDGQPTHVGELLLGPWQRGRLGLVNAFGNGIADDKLLHGHVEDFIRFYLDEEPLIRSVPSYPLDTADQRRELVGRLHELVIKPRHGHGGHGVVIGAHAGADELAAVAAELQRSPGDYIVQPIVPLSRHPTVIEGRLEPRHVDLRVFAFCADTVGLIPGGLTRVALEEGALIVNSSQDGGGKDTWVLG